MHINHITLIEIKLNLNKAVVDKDNKEVKRNLKIFENNILGKKYIYFSYFDFILVCLRNHILCSFRSSSWLIYIIFDNFYKLTNKQKEILLIVLDDNIYNYLNFDLRMIIITLLENKYYSDNDKKIFLKWKTL